MSSASLAELLSLPKEILHVLLILLIAWVSLLLSRRLIRLLRNYMNGRSETAEEKRRIETLARVFRYIDTVTITLVAVMLVLSALGISIAPILGAAGVVGLALGFGAQSLIKDYFNGFFMLVENQIRQGDAVEICGKLGDVEDITLRYVCLRDVEGNVHYVPNGQITTVTNKSRDYGYALIDVGVAYREDLDHVYGVIREVGAALRLDQDLGEKILADVQIQGVQDWADSAVMIRCRFKTVALEQWNVRRAFLGKLKQAFDRAGIEIPYPHMTIYAGQDKHGKAAPFHLIKQLPDN